MKLKDFMSRHGATVSPRTPAERARSPMKAGGIRHLVVVEAGRVLGVVSDRDLGGRRADAFRCGLTVADVMARHTVTARPATTLRQATDPLQGRSIGCPPVVDSAGRLKGIVTTTDVLEVVGRGLERVAADADGKRRTSRSAAARRGGPPGRR